MYLFPYKVYKSDLKASGKLTTWAACGCASEQGEPKLVRGMLPILHLITLKSPFVVLCVNQTEYLPVAVFSDEALLIRWLFFNWLNFSDVVDIVRGKSSKYRL